jgi:hypothetical protein
MLLRDHPQMRYRGHRSWPPDWTWLSGVDIEKKGLSGEIGILREVAPSLVLPVADRCFLYIDHEGSSYIGSLLFDDSTFCSQIVELLRRLLESSCRRDWEHRPRVYFVMNQPFQPTALFSWLFFASVLARN